VQRDHDGADRHRDDDDPDHDRHHDHADHEHDDDDDHDHHHPDDHDDDDAHHPDHDHAGQRRRDADDDAMTDIVGRYRLGRRLGVGGMSTVHEAQDLRLQRPVAVKLLAEHLADDSTFVSRFQREALSAARLVHPNIVQVFDSGLDPETGQHFIVMEYVAGPSMAEVLRDRGYLGVDEAVGIVAQACQGLDYAHRQGVVHRDVKPGNLLQSPDGAIKLADFGIAKAAEQSSITQVGSVLGTAAYLAPEQAQGESATPQSDLYSLGVVTYQLLAGRLPYQAESLSELVLKQQQGPPPSLSHVNPEVPPTLAAAVEAALSIHARGRYESARAMGEALQTAARGIAPPSGLLGDTSEWEETGATSVLRERTGPTRAVPREPVPARRPLAPRAAPAPPPAARRQPARRGPRRALTVLVILLLLAAGAAVAVYATSTNNQQVRLRQVVHDRVDQTVDAMKQLVKDNTR
jgi:serine/threonine-protein kinase